MHQDPVPQATRRSHVQRLARARGWVRGVILAVRAAGGYRRIFAVVFPVLALLLVSLAFADGGLQGVVRRATGTSPLVNHVAGFFALSLSGFAAAGFDRRRVLRMAAVLVVLGIAIEVGQVFVTHREASILDALASAAGVLLALLACTALAVLWQRRPRRS